MIKLLPFVLIFVLILGGLGYWHYSSSKSNLTTPSTTQQEVPVEVPKTLPKESLDDRVKTLEDLVTKLTTQVNNLKSSSSQSSTTSDSKTSSMETTIIELKARVSALEKASPAPVSDSGAKSPLYIPLGSSGSSLNNTDWTILNEFEASINPDNYGGYSSMQLEATFRLDDSSGTGSVRLYNVTDSSAVNSQIDTTSTSFSSRSSPTFKLPSGTKTYKLQIKSSGGKNLFPQSARIKVNF